MDSEQPTNSLPAPQLELGPLKYEGALLLPANPEWETIPWLILSHSKGESLGLCQLFLRATVSFPDEDLEDDSELLNPLEPIFLDDLLRRGSDINWSNIGPTRTRGGHTHGGRSTSSRRFAPYADPRDYTIPSLLNSSHSSSNSPVLDETLDPPCSVDGSFTPSYTQLPVFPTAHSTQQPDKMSRAPKFSPPRNTVNISTSQPSASVFPFPDFRDLRGPEAAQRASELHEVSNCFCFLHADLKTLCRFRKFLRSATVQTALYADTLRKLQDLCSISGELPSCY